MPITSTRHRAVPRRVLLVGAAVVVAVVVAVTVWVRHGASSSTRVPYTDAAATGVIGLCDRHGHDVTTGSTKAGPFVWRAVGSSAATGAYAVAGRTATLYAFQPRPGVDPAGWSGQQLTASSSYTNPAHPMAQATTKDIDLADFLAAFHALDAGVVELRLYLGAPNQPLATQRYDATDVKVSGSSWRVLRGGPVTCTDGNAVSLETQVGLAGPASP
jgi:hypothetical protein